MSMPGSPYRKTSKYRAKPTPYKGITYASRAEAKRAMELDLMKQSGEISWWLRQVPVDIGEPGVDKPYRVDFLVCMGGDVWAEDVKGVETASFRRHVRQWRLRGPFELHVIKKKKIDVIPKGEEV